MPVVMLVTSIGIISFYSHLKFSVEFKVSYLDPYGRLQILSSRSHYCNFPHLFYLLLLFSWGLTWWLSGKEPSSQCRRHRRYSSFSGSASSSGGGNGNLLQYSCLENSIDGGEWWAAVHGVTKSWAQLSD